MGKGTRTKEQGRTYYHEHKQERMESKKKYRRSEKGKATAAAHAKRYREENREKIAAAKKRYREENREKVNAQMVSYTRRHPEKKAAYRQRAKMKSPAYQMYVAWRKQPCSRCGIEDWRVVQAHHTDPTQKKFMVSELARLMESGLLEEELAKCIPLCANCHLILHHHPDTAG